MIYPSDFPLDYENFAENKIHVLFKHKLKHINVLYPLIEEVSEFYMS